MIERKFEELSELQKADILDRFRTQIERFGLPERIEFYDTESKIVFSMQNGTEGCYKW